MPDGRPRSASRCGRRRLAASARRSSHRSSPAAQGNCRNCRKCSGGSSPKWRSRIARRQVAASTKAASAFEPLALLRPSRRLDLGLDPAAGAGEILGAPEQPGLGRVAVATGAAGFLVIGLDRLGHAGMGDEADVGLVDAHAEGDGRGHHHLFAGDERRLVALRAPWARARHDRAAPAARRRGELLGELLGRGAAGRIDDPGPRLLVQQRA